MFELPAAFCWTKFGFHAAEPIGQILARKEVEREPNGGIFYWGIGNSVAQGIAALLEVCEHPEVLFSPIRSRPRPRDVTPLRRLSWTSAETPFGLTFELP